MAAGQADDPRTLQGTAGRRALRVQTVLRPGEIREAAVATVKGLFLRHIERHHEVVAVFLERAKATHNAGLVGLPTATSRRRPCFRGRLDAVVVLPQNEVDDARDRITAVDTGGAVTQDFNPIHRRQGYRVDVNGRSVRRKVGEPPTIDQHEGALRAQTAQGHGREAVGGNARAFAGVVRTHEARRRERVEQLLGVHCARTLDVSAIEGGDG